MTTFKFSIPTGVEGARPLVLELSEGQSVFVLGANGTGKSGLMHFFYTQYASQCVRMSAHRQTWLSSDALDLSPKGKRNSEQGMRTLDARPDARWKDEFAAARANIALYELIDAEHIRARGIVTCPR